MNTLLICFTICYIATLIVYYIFSFGKFLVMNNNTDYYVWLERQNEIVKGYHVVEFNKSQIK